MTSSIRRGRGMAAVVGTAAVALVLSACSSDSGDSDSGSGDGGDTAASGEIDCSVYEEFGDLSGTEVNVYTSIVEPESDQQKESYVPFEECTGVTVNYEGSREFEAQLLVRLQAGNAPDVAYMPQPGLLSTIVHDFSDQVVPAGDATVSMVDEYFTESWKGFGTVDGTFYAAPLGSNGKSFVWYSPSAFSDAGYEVPTTWDELMQLSETIASDTGAPPWCAGVESGDATGWPGTDFIEDVVVRHVGVEGYEAWYTHEAAFNAPEYVESWDIAGEILKNPEMVNGGLGDVTSVATTSWTDAGYPILDGNCYLHRAANFYQTQWPEGTTVAEDGDVWAFYMPAMNEDTKPMLVGGEFVLAFDDRPEVQAFQTYLASADWANNKAKATPGGGWVSANSGLDPANLGTDFDRLVWETLSSDEYTAVFDGSDLMPGAVGAGTFWTGVVDWLTGATSQEVTDSIEAGWPN
ncbi:ABC transporter substrate-binding protein [Serinibacter salmoneus]|uniref:Carbohydrate ABC transporter substrate-binding protein (CUT1 family) n=1 Tax=Serinibacter salmoneus TaxID=556530 RepID=A0A2A9D2Q7_9MICO|nr:ABC transporter substrate-binding protein [Serinibacter salmoneus]PFG20987.1 carbohydrate ABC transporter substrate-binding protein (CUT1 family) [Serinibacter salmoneus]